MKVPFALVALVALGLAVGFSPHRADAQAVIPRLDRWVVDVTGITAPKNADGDDAVYEVIGVTNTDADANATCDLHVDNHGNATDGATITMTDPATPFVIRSGDTLTATGNAACVLVLTVFSGYPIGTHPVPLPQHT